MALLTVHNLGITFGGAHLLNEIDLVVERGERVCLIGRNGCGKSTVLRLIAGEMEADSGTIGLESGAKTAYLEQEQLDRPAETAIELMEDRVAGMQYLTRLGIAADARTETLSGGELRRVFLARMLSMEADLLLADEPTNHLDLDTVLWLEDHLLRSPVRRAQAIVFVTHDRAFARRLATRVVEIDRGNLLSFAGGYDAFLERRDAFLEAEAAGRQVFDKKLSEEEAWLRRGVKARRTRNEGRVKALLEMRRRYNERRDREGTAGMGIAEAQRSGDLVIDAEDVGFSWPGQAGLLISNCTTRILRGDRVGVVGPNGSGKTTLLRLLSGELSPVSGRVRTGAALKTVYFDQLRRQLHPDDTLFQAIGEGYDTIEVNGKQRHVLAYLRDFLFHEDDIRKPVRSFSGGERNRLLLAKLFARQSNLLVLDEPTNDLDGQTLELLEELLLRYTGTLLLVSHDREFLDNVVTDCLVLSGDGSVVEHSGGYSDWREKYGALRLPNASGGSAAATTPATPAATTATTATTTPAARVQDRPDRLSYRETRDLERLPDTIARLEAEQDDIHRLLADPELYRRAADGEATVSESGVRTPAELTSRLTQLAQEIDASYQRWEHLEARRDSDQ